MAGAASGAPPPTLRVWLEPKYDHGRWGAWMLDWPGCFCWGDSRDNVLARSNARVMGFVEWLRSHGEEIPRPTPGRETIIEEVAARVIADGYEINAIFEADRRAVAAEELERTLRWLDYAHADLIAIGDRIRAIEGAGQTLSRETREPEAIADGAEDGRDADLVLRHVAGAETWLASRLDRSLRYAGPARDGDLGAFQEATHQWAVASLRALWRRDPALSGTDGKGEDWTLAKVLRRIVYHSLDHLDELDRRLAVVEDRLGFQTAPWAMVRRRPKVG